MATITIEPKIVKTKTLLKKTKSYANRYGFNNIYNKETLSVLDDIRQSKNLSKPYSSARDMINDILLEEDED